jgi:Transposase domain (DUF772)
VNDALAALAGDFSALYSRMGRPSIPPEKLLRAMLLQAFYSIRSERQLMERLEFDLLFRWFVGIGVDDTTWDHSVFSKNRERLPEGDVAAKLLSAVLAQPRVERLLSTTPFLAQIAIVGSGLSQLFAPMLMARAGLVLDIPAARWRIRRRFPERLVPVVHRRAPRAARRPTQRSDARRRYRHPPGQGATR